MNSLNIPAGTSALVHREDKDLKDFTFAGCKVVLNWRGTKVKDAAFWTITAPGLGPCHPPIEIHVKQVEKLRLALGELEMRLAGFAMPENELNQREEAK
jgi:hypothetical protein